MDTLFTLNGLTNENCFDGMVRMCFRGMRAPNDSIIHIEANLRLLITHIHTYLESDLLRGDLLLLRE